VTRHWDTQILFETSFDVVNILTH